MVVGFCFFFFQAEDGIRDWSVTGVQTCALPISGVRDDQSGLVDRALGIGDEIEIERARGPAGLGLARSEERRVGKECRGGGGAESEKEKGGEEGIGRMKMSRVSQQTSESVEGKC